MGTLSKGCIRVSPDTPRLVSGAAPSDQKDIQLRGCMKALYQKGVSRFLGDQP